nr:MAG TPA: hypothetical protein [Caudoviricetes sp.]
MFPLFFLIFIIKIVHIFKHGFESFSNTKCIYYSTPNCFISKSYICPIRSLIFNSFK